MGELNTKLVFDLRTGPCCERKKNNEQQCWPGKKWKGYDDSND
jgi:hypothetical protein